MDSVLKELFLISPSKSELLISILDLQIFIKLLIRNCWFQRKNVLKNTSLKDPSNMFGLKSFPNLFLKGKKSSYLKEYQKKIKIGLKYSRIISRRIYFPTSLENKNLFTQSIPILSSREFNLWRERLSISAWSIQKHSTIIMKCWAIIGVRSLRYDLNQLYLQDWIYVCLMFSMIFMFLSRRSDERGDFTLLARSSFQRERPIWRLVW